MVDGSYPCVATYVQANTPQSDVLDCVFTLEASVVNKSWLIQTSLAKYKIALAVVLIIEFNGSYCHIQ